MPHPSIHPLSDLLRDAGAAVVNPNMHWVRGRSPPWAGRQSTADSCHIHYPFHFYREIKKISVIDVDKKKALQLEWELPEVNSEELNRLFPEMEETRGAQRNFSREKTKPKNQPGAE